VSAGDGCIDAAEFMAEGRLRVEYEEVLEW